MLNMKKGLALVLAAATAFTFAPVANLGASVDAKAGQILNYSNTQVNLQVGETRTIELADLNNAAWLTNELTDLSLDVADPKVATAQVSKEGRGVAKFDDTTISGSGVTQKAISGGTWNPEKAKSVVIKGLTDGSTTITLSVKNDSGVTVAKETLTVNVSDKVSNVTFGKDKVEFTKVGKDAYQFKDDGNSTYENTVTLVNPNQKGTKGHKIELKSSDEKVATVATKDGKNTFSNNTQSIVVVTPKGVGSATIDVTVKYLDDKNVEHSECSASFTVVVSDSTDTLTVKYDPSRTGKQTKVELSTTPNAQVKDLAGTGKIVSYANGSTDAKEYDAAKDGNNEATNVVLYDTPTLFLDSLTNTTAKLDINDSMGRAYTVTSSNSWIAVDNAGNIVVSDPSTGKVGTAESPIGYINVSVPQAKVNNKTVAGLTITIKVVVYNKDTTSLKVSEASNQKYLGKTVGGEYGTDNFDDDEVLYLSTKDKKSADLAFETNAGTQYITGVAKTTDGKVSDVVSYSNGRLTALKSGDAIVTITCRNSASTYGTAVVKFAVRVVTKNANNVITTSADSYSLTKSAPTASIGAKSTYNTVLKYSLVKEVNSTEEVTSSDITVDANGNLKYSGNNQGSVVVRISGNETVEALAPADKYVTVNYSNTKAASTISVADKEINLKPGASQKIAATGSALTYKSSNEDVATVAQDGTVTAIKAGAAIITVTSPEDAEHVQGQEFVTVLVSDDKAPVEYKTPAKVKGVKVSNNKGAKVTVKFTKDKTNKNVQYKIQKQVRKNSKAKWSKVSSKKIGSSTKTTLSVKKGYQVRTRVKAYYYGEDGKLYAGSYSKWVTKKTDKK